MDCTGCGNCADICPAPEKALVMVNAEEEMPRQLENWEYAANHVTYKDHLMAKTNVSGSQFAQPPANSMVPAPAAGVSLYHPGHPVIW